MYLDCVLFAFFLAMPIGVGSIKMLQNGINKSPFHAFWTGTGYNVVDCIMFALYYFGLSYIFTIYEVKIIIYIVGMFVLSKLAFSCFVDAKITFGNNVRTINPRLLYSFIDGIKVALVPSSLIYWVNTYGIVLSNHLQNHKTFLIASISILTGFFFSNIAYGCIAHIIKKYANQTIIKWVNIVSGTVLFGFAIYFMIKLILL